MRAGHILVSVGLLWGLAACAIDPAATRAAFERGLVAYDGGDYPTAYAIWNDIRDQDLAALRNVAVMARNGTGVAKAPKRALRLMTLAAEAGLVTARADLGEMLLAGEGGPPDAVAAAFWLELAAEGGHPVAAFTLADLYTRGEGVACDPAKARHFLEIAARQGHHEAAARLAEMPPPP